MTELFGKLSEVVILGNIEVCDKLAQEALDEGSSARDILEKGLIPGMDIVGQRFKAGDMFIPEVLLSARTMHGAMEILEPLLSESDAKGAGTVIIGTVEGDLHDIGKNLVMMMLRGAGFKVMDLGINVKPQDFVEGVLEHKPDIIGMSALLTTTMPKMQETIDSLTEAGLRNQVKVMAGGAAVTQDFVDKIGADAFGTDAAEAVEKARALIGQKVDTE